jgi:ferrochelatase
MSNLLLVNFGGPRSKEEIAPFLKALLTDPDVIHTPLPFLLQRWLFTWFAHKRAKKIAPDYDLIGGKSPIYADTEALAAQLREKSGMQVLTFHRYLPSTHAASLKAIQEAAQGNISVFPLFPQFSYATTGSIARFFAQHLPEATMQRLNWVKSYSGHPSYVQAMQATIREFLQKHQLVAEEVLLLFSAHGLPQDFVLRGDIYEKECQTSFEAIRQVFPKALSLLSYQSKFGRGEWLRPYTNEICENIGKYSEGRKHVVIVPLSFTSDHIETLFEIEYQYLPLIRAKGGNAWRCPALNLREDWIEGILNILQDANFCENRLLVKQK